MVFRAIIGEYVTQAFHQKMNELGLAPNSTQWRKPSQGWSSREPAPAQPRYPTYPEYGPPHSNVYSGTQPPRQPPYTSANASPRRENSPMEYHSPVRNAGPPTPDSHRFPLSPSRALPPPEFCTNPPTPPASPRELIIAQPQISPPPTPLNSSISQLLDSIFTYASTTMIPNTTGDVLPHPLLLTPSRLTNLYAALSYPPHLNPALAPLLLATSLQLPDPLKTRNEALRVYFTIFDLEYAVVRDEEGHEAPALTRQGFKDAVLLDVKCEPGVMWERVELYVERFGGELLEVDGEDVAYYKIGVRRELFPMQSDDAAYEHRQSARQRFNAIFQSYVAQLRRL